MTCVAARQAAVFADEHRCSSGQNWVPPERAGMFPADRSIYVLGVCGAAHFRPVIGAETMLAVGSIFQSILAVISGGLVDQITQLILGLFGGPVG